MAVAPVLISNVGGSPTPKTYALGASESFIPTAITALFNGAGASSAFLACATLYAPSGELMARTFPPVPLEAGASSTVTFSPPINDAADAIATGISAKSYKLISGASTNATSVKASAGLLVGWALGNNNASARYVKLYDKASSPTVGSDTPKITFRLPPEASANVPWTTPILFSTGIAFATTTGAADSDTGAVAANEITVNLFYL